VHKVCDFVHNFSEDWSNIIIWSVLVSLKRTEAHLGILLSSYLPPLQIQIFMFYIHVLILRKHYRIWDSHKTDYAVICISIREGVFALIVCHGPRMDRNRIFHHTLKGRCCWQEILCEDCRFQWYDAVWLLLEPPIQRNISPPSSR
jgi:hypothetical protein